MLYTSSNMSEIIHANFGRKPGEKNRLPEQNGAPNNSAEPLVPAVPKGLANSLAARLLNQLRRESEHGLDGTKLELIRSFKSQVSEREVEKVRSEYQTYTTEDAIAVIRDNDENIIKTKPAFFLAMLRILDIR